mmetsp:Transcript_37973/g.61524  ORF Transcript_37973/g.61524 Transcript_37973/m.61524 type:complete len:488 (+) Transcript_37973:128-1591(+)
MNIPVATDNNPDGQGITLSAFLTMFRRVSRPKRAALGDPLEFEDQHFLEAPESTNSPSSSSSSSSPSLSSASSSSLASPSPSALSHMTDSASSVTGHFLVFFELPDELQAHVLSFLDERSLARCEQTCRALREMICLKARFWSRSNPASVSRREEVVSMRLFGWSGSTAQDDTLNVKRVLAGKKACEKEEAAILHNKPTVTPLGPGDHDGTVWRVSANGNVAATACFDGFCQTYELTSGRKLHSLMHPSRIWGVCVDKQGGPYVATSTDDGHAYVWNVESGRQVASFYGHRDEVNSVALSGSTVVTASDDYTARVWDWTNNCSSEAAKCRFVLTGHTNKVWGVSMDKETMAVTSSKDTTLRVWDLADGKCRHVLRGHGAGVLFASVEGNTIGSASHDCTVRLWDAVTGHCMKVLSGHTNSVYDVNLQGNLCLSSSADGLRVWDIRTGQNVRWLRSVNGCMSGVLAGTNIVSSHDGGHTVRLWNLAGN